MLPEADEVFVFAAGIGRQGGKAAGEFVARERLAQVAVVVGLALAQGVERV